MRIFLGAILLLFPAAFAQAQTCLKSVNLTSVCGASQVKAGSGVCLNGTVKTVGSASASCVSAITITNQLNSLCQTSGACNVAPPQTTSVAVSVRSIYKSKVVSAGVADLQFGHYYRDLLWCMDLLHNYKLKLNAADSRNAALLNQPTDSQWLSVSLVCPSAPSLFQDPNTGVKTYTYPAGCYVTSFAPSSQPSPPSGYCY